jgi:spore germination protein GerM
MAKQKKKRNQAKTGCLIWIAAFLILLILFLVKFEDIRTIVEKTGFIDALNHAVSKQDSVPQQKPQGTKPEAPAPISELPLAAPPAEKPQIQSPIEPQETTTAAPKNSKSPSVSPSEPEPIASSPGASVSKLPKEEQKMRTAVLYFVRIGDDGSISSQKVKRTIPVSDSPLQDTLELLLKGPTESELRANLLSLIPADARLRSINTRGSTVILDFNDAFAYNRYGKEGYIAQLRQIVYTLTEFQNIIDVQFLIEGKSRAFLSEGIALDKPWSRASF